MRRPLLTIAAILSPALAALIALIVARSAPGPTYYFMPGALGRVRAPLRDARVAPVDRLTGESVDQGRLRRPVDPWTGRSVDPINRSTDQPIDRSTVPQVNRARGYLTRAISGLRAGAEAEWGQHNGVTTGPWFMHNLASVFPRELYATHPEFFPLTEGKRLDPPPDSRFWNPDLGRNDVASWAANAAKAYFAAHPEAVSFSLGVNDGLVFGESVATTSLTGWGPGATTESSSGGSGAAAPSGGSVDQSNSRSDAEQPIRRSTDPLRVSAAAAPSGGSVDRLNSRSDADQPIHGSTDQPRETSRSAQPVRWFRGRPDYSRLVFTFMNRAASELARSYPDKYLGCLAYYWCENTPGFPVDPHVIPFLTADRSQSYDPAFVRQEFDLQARWASALRGPSAPGRSVDQSIRGSFAAPSPASRGSVDRLNRRSAPDPQIHRSTDPRDGEAATDQPHTAQPRPRLGLYDYLDDLGFLVPRVPIHAFAEHIRHAHEVGFTDYYGESSRNWGLDGPMPWVIAQLLQDPEQNVDRLLDIYYRNYFGPAAGPMRAFFDRCEQQWMHQSGPSYWLKHYRNESQATLFPPEVCRELRHLLDEAATAAAPSRGSVDRLNSRPEADRPIHRSTDLQRETVFARRVAFVSDSFGVTERFCAFQEAREALARLVLAGSSQVGRTVPGGSFYAQSLTTALQRYLDARREFIRDSFAVTRRWPLAFYPINYDDWLKDDPSFASAYALAKLGSSGGSVDQLSGGSEADPPIHRSTDLQRVSADQRINRSTDLLAMSAPAADAGMTAALAERHARELLPDGSLEGALVPGRRIAGLQYGIDLPAPWKSKVEPTEHHLGVVWRPAARTGTQGLRISGAEIDQVFQWVPATPGALYTASVAVCGQVSTGDAVTLNLAWLDAKDRRVGSPRLMRLPEGRWPQWVTLRQGGRAPAGAAWVGISITVQHQVPGDWVEADDFSLRMAR